MVALNTGTKRARQTASRVSRVALSLVLIASLRWPAGAAPVQPAWTSYGPEVGTITALAIDPQTPSTLYAVITDSSVRAFHGDLPPGALFKTTDAGRSWRLISTGLPNI